MISWFPPRHFLMLVSLSGACTVACDSTTSRVVQPAEVSGSTAVYVDGQELFPESSGFARLKSVASPDAPTELVAFADLGQGRSLLAWARDSLDGRIAWIDDRGFHELRCTVSFALVSTGATLDATGCAPVSGTDLGFAEVSAHVAASTITDVDPTSLSSVAHALSSARDESRSTSERNCPRGFCECFTGALREPACYAHLQILCISACTFFCPAPPGGCLRQWLGRSP